MNAFTLVTVDAQKRKITHGLQKYCDRAEIFAERAVILKYKGKRNSEYIVKRISGEKQPKHNFLKICDLEQKQNARSSSETARTPVPATARTSHSAKRPVFLFAASVAAYKEESPKP